MIARIHISHYPSSIARASSPQSVQPNSVRLPGMSLRIPRGFKIPTDTFCAKLHVTLGSVLQPRSIFVALTEICDVTTPNDCHIVPLLGEGWILTGSTINAAPIGDVEARFAQRERIMSRGHTYDCQNGIPGVTVMLRDRGAVIATRNGARWLIQDQGGNAPLLCINLETGTHCSLKQTINHADWLP